RDVAGPPGRVWRREPDQHPGQVRDAGAGRAVPHARRVLRARAITDVRSPRTRREVLMPIGLRGVVTIALAAGCAQAPLGGIRFRNQLPVWRVNDRRNVATAPVTRKYYRAPYPLHGFVVR